MKKLISKLRLYWSMVGYANAHNRDFAREHAAFFQLMCERLARMGKDPRGVRVLDVGCGKSYWLTLLLKGYGSRVTGVDTEEIYPGRSVRKYLSIASSNGLERSARTLVWDVVYAAPYYRELLNAVNFQQVIDAPDVRRMDISEPAFPAGEFDLIVSHEVFEHIADIQATVRHLKRLLKPDGLTYIYIHSYCSLSGGHHIAWKYPDVEPSTEVPPWDHLRDRRFPDIPSWLNELREAEYRAAFEAHFEILDWIYTAREGERLLTPEIRRELSAYSEHELLTKGFIVVARPRAEPASKF